MKTADWLASGIENSTELLLRYVAHATLAAAVREAGEAGLQRQVQWGASGTMVSGLELVLRMLFHNGTHCGQIVDLRRALGMPSVIQGASPPRRT